MSSNISVAVRVRPANFELGEQSVVSVERGCDVILSKKRASKDRVMSYNSLEKAAEVFSFDSCYAHFNNTQEDIYRDIGVQTVNAVNDGFNCCVFAYGQTASGKTHTMFGSENSEGLTPRILKTLLSKIPPPTSSHSDMFTIKMGYLEIYNEKVRDLLGWRPSNSNVPFELPSLKIREHPLEGVFVQGLTMHLLQSYDEMKHFLKMGNRLRVIGSTNINEHSSRSHAVIILKFIRKDPIPNGVGFSETSSKLHLIDLAGSERIKQTGATSKRLKEGISINQSLTNLGKTISLLVEYSKLDPQKRQAFHIPYRNSSLTFLLKDSLGGNSKTFMVATISEAAQNYSETRNTLLYASRARKIVNKPVVNQDTSAQIIGDLKKEIECLKRLLAEASLQPISSPSVDSNESEVDSYTGVSSSVPVEDCCVHSRVIRNQLNQDEKAIGELLNATFESSSDYNQDMDTHEFGPPFICLNANEGSSKNALCGMFFLREGETKLGSDASKVDLLVEDPNVLDVHCSFFVEDDSATIIRHENASITINGDAVTSHQFVNHGNEIKLSESTVFNFNFPSQLASRLIRRQLPSSRASLLSPPRSVSSCSSDTSSRPLSQLFVDVSSMGSVIHSQSQSRSSPDDSRFHSLPCRSSRMSTEHHHELTLREAETEPAKIMMSPEREEIARVFCDSCQQTDEYKCCAASEELERFHKLLIESCKRGVEEIFGENEVVRQQLECQMDLIRCDNRKMALLEQKLYTEIEEELAALNKSRQKLNKSRTELQQTIDCQIEEFEKLNKSGSSRKTSSKSSSSDDNLFHLDYKPSSCRDFTVTHSPEDNDDDELSESHEYVQATSNRYVILRDLHEAMENKMEENKLLSQKKIVMHKSISTNENKLLDIERKLDSISEKCQWLCSYCDKLKNYFESERCSMRDFEKKVARICVETKRQLSMRENNILSARDKIQDIKVKSCPASPLVVPAKDSFSGSSFFSRGNSSDMFGFSSVGRRRPRKTVSSSANIYSRSERRSRLFAEEALTSDIPTSCDDSGIFLSSRERSDSSFSANSLPNPSLMPSAFNFMKRSNVDSMVSIAVPRFRRQRSQYKYFHEYQIDVSLRDEAWTVFHRFSALRDVHLALKSKYPELQFLDFPPRKAFGSRLEKVAAERRLQLQQYLQCLVSLCVYRIEKEQEYSSSASWNNIGTDSSSQQKFNGLTKQSLMQLLPFLNPSISSSSDMMFK